jgi:antitoxin component of MazEF toxin-antitoxin module
MITQIKKIGNHLFIEIPDSIEKLYKLKETCELPIHIIEKNNSLIINCVLLNLNNDF